MKNVVSVPARFQAIFGATFSEPVFLPQTLGAKRVPGWESLMHISLMPKVEAAFSIRLRMGRVESARNAGQFAGLILKRMQES
jgi:acyl carrier protein